MNNKFLQEAENLRTSLKNHFDELGNEWDQLHDEGKSTSEVTSEMNLVKQFYVDLTSDIKKYKNAQSEEERTAIYNEMVENYNLSASETESDELEVVETKNNSGLVKRIISGALAVVLVGTCGYFIGRGSNKYNNDDDTYIEETIDDDTLTEETTEDNNLEFESELTDAKDNDQVVARATEYYNKYISNNSGVNALTIDDIANDIRIMNGEFKLENGETTYNSQDIIDTATDLHTIANYDSFGQYDNDINYTPIAPLFVDGTLEQTAAKQLDEKMEAVVSAINADDTEAFVEAATDWGYVVVNMFDYVDFNGEIVNINQVNTPAQFQLYHAMRSKYASTILEYSEKYGLNICLDYCINLNTCETEKVALSTILYNLDERAIDAVAVRSGNLDEYESNNLSLPEDLCVKAQNYFNSKYDLEKGYSRSLN